MIRLILRNKGSSFEVFDQAKFDVQIDKGKKDSLVRLLPSSFSAVRSDLPVNGYTNRGGGAVKAPSQHYKATWFCGPGHHHGFKRCFHYIFV